jgi:hypothetical protein
MKTTIEPLAYDVCWECMAYNCLVGAYIDHYGYAEGKINETIAAYRRVTESDRIDYWCEKGEKLTSFSKSPCEVCGSRLPGERFRLIAHRAGKGGS